MPISNEDVAAQFSELADLLDIEGANRFRVRAYRTAAHAIADLPDSVAARLERGTDLSELPGIGEDLAGKVAEIVETGRLSLLDEVEARVPPSLADLLDIPGISATRARRLYEELGVTGPGDLRQAAEQGRISGLKGFSDKTERDILRKLDQQISKAERVRLKTAEARVEPLAAHLRDQPAAGQVAIAGSIRRRQETCGDADLVATAEDGRETALVEALCGWEDVQEVVSRGENRASVRLSGGFQVDLRVVPAEGFGAALHYFTGALAHHLKFRQMAVERGETFNEYGIFQDEERVAGRDEEEVYGHFGLPYIVPELREDRGEIEAAREGRLPQLVRPEDIRGDLHCHTQFSDGAQSLAEMVDAAKALGYDYLAITDHCQGHAGPPGLDPDALARQADEIAALRERHPGIAILRGAEVDILEDGRLDLPDKVMDELDIVVFSIHAHLQLSPQDQTQRLLTAMDNPHGHILGHPTERILGKRGALEVDMDALIDKAAERGIILEVNANPSRLDLSDVNCRRAKERGVTLAISTDAHMTENLHFMRYGVDQARRGWLEAADIANTRTLPDLRHLLARRK
ncbi:MAG: DNA polymerase/3'-5' exonuclease PolX [Alphaproteobacteria bacterium]|jgi:DNA polymerase (family 10)|nr:DNA polymerase/3'-5' exonuclease PolX [Alphaproteobacteria bacterium]